MTMKSADLNDRAPESYVEISRADAERFNIVEGDMVNIASRRGSIAVRARILSKAVGGTVFIPFHFAKGAANQLTNAALDPVSGIPEFKVCAVKIDKAA
jgi:formate dehydrogenase major subunit/formate dehydrogenase alpha subunit